MNFSFYIYGTPNGYNQYPADNKNEVFQDFVQNDTTESQLTVYRKGQLVYYSYLRKLQEKSAGYLGFCLTFNGIYCKDSKKLFALFDKVFDDVQIKGEFLRFEKGKYTFVVDKFIEKPIEIERIKTLFKYNLENDFNRDFEAIPATFKVGNGKKTISVKEAGKDIQASIAEFDIVHISNNEKSLSELERAHKMLKDLYAENQKLDTKYRKLESQKKNYKIVMILCLVVIGCIAGLLAFNKILKSQSGQISDLNNNVIQMQNEIENLRADTTQLQVQLQEKQSEMISDSLRFTDQINQLSTINETLTAENKQLNSDKKNLSGTVLDLERQSSSYKNEISTLKTKNQSLSSDVEYYRKYIPQTYSVISKADYYYRNKCNDSYKKTNCIANPGEHINIFVIANGYGLSEYGWIPMSSLTK